jgi:Ca2+-binding RTX toxin-like protein
MTLNVLVDSDINSDQLSISGPAITYGATNLTVTIEDNVLVDATTDEAISSNQSGSILTNNGTIFSAADLSVHFTQAGGSITNNARATMASNIDAIGVDHNNTSITNHGAVIAYAGTGVRTGTGSTGHTLINDGSIFGHAAGVEIFATGDVINNSGTIRSDAIGSGIGIFVRTFTSFSAIVIDNAHGGLIQGSFSAINANAASALISLNNRGVIDGSVICSFITTADDVIRNSGKIKGDVQLGLGSDTFNGKGGTSGAVFGGAGDDTITGGNKHDVLIGNSGFDHLKGSGGRDSFKFVALGDSAVGVTRDVIRDFSHTQHDKIDLQGIDANSGVGGDQAFHFIGARGFHGVAGELRYAHHILQGDVDGNGAADFEIHVNIASLAKGDFIL